MNCGTTLLLSLLASLTFLSPAQAQAAPTVTLTPQEGAFGMINRPWPATPGGPVAPVKLTIQGAGKVTLTATDAWGKPLDWKQDVDFTAGPAAVEFAAPYGAYRLEAHSGADLAGACSIGFIPPFHPGVRKDSFFASNTSSIRQGEELRMLQAIGMKVQRTHFHGTKPETMEVVKQHDTWVLPIVGYAIGKKSEWAEKYKMHGPPADFADFCAQWEKTLRQHPEVTTYEFWNEPWIFGWSWADTPEQYRKLQTMWCQMALKVNPQLRIIAGNSWMFTQDHLQFYPDAWKGTLQGTTHHPYTGAGDLTFRPGGNARSIDGGMLVNRQMGLPYYYLTEGGSSVGSREFGNVSAAYPTPDNLLNARKVVQYFVRSALTGCFQGDMQWGLGYGAGWTRSNASFAVLTHFTEDRPVVADIWPEHELIYGAIFANPRHITDEVKALPRAKDLSARWAVPVPDDRKVDPTKVAVLWSWTGEFNDKVDQNGTLTIADAAGLRAFDLFGKEIAPQGGKLVLPFTENPVYVTTDTLTVVQLRGRLARAELANLTPVNLYALSLLQPAEQKQNLIVRLENQMNVAVRGELALTIPGGKPTTAAFEAGPGKLVEVAVPWPGVAPSSANQYPVQLDATVQSVRGTPLGRVSRAQMLQAARFARKSIAFTGRLADWQGLTPITLSSTGKADPTKYLLNPHLKPEADTPTTGTARIFTAYDDKFIYVGVAGWGAKCTVGGEAKPGLPFKKGDPAGLNFISLCGDVVQIAFGFRDRVPQAGRQMDDPWAWKGQFYDTDYQYVAHTSPEGPKLLRLWGADTDRRTPYQCDTIPHVGPIPGGAILITDQIYEIAIPRSELKLFDPAKDRFRFSVLLNGKHNWADAVGVFDYWQSSGSFGPSWEMRTPAQTFFGIER